MKRAKAFFHYAVLAFAFTTLLSSCKSSDDETEEPSADPATGTAPVIWGDPATSVVVNTQYLFLPEASDEDGDVLSFSIANKPVWAEFDTASGQLQGVPESDHVGEHQDIVISVTDDNSVVSLPAFAITVSEAGDGGTGGGGTDTSAPSIAGEPNEFTVVGSTYAFQPQASDADGDTLSYSIVNKPVWASFNTATGRLEGKPTSSHLGQSGPIELSVTDGSSIAALATFTITVEATGSESYTVSWVPPTENEDGTALTDLAGYRIYYGTVSGSYTETIELGSGMTSYLIDNLAPGRYFLVMTSVNSQAMESRYTPELTVQPAS